MTDYRAAEKSKHHVNIHADYEETIAFIKNLTKFGINLGLERIKALLDRLGNPEKKLNVIHIGGTNGKGSTAAMLREILVQAGYRTGMYISPHLHDFRERITINGEQISKEDVTAGINEIKSHLQAIIAQGVEHPTEFEVSTALGLLYFANKQPDFVIVEVGMGGEIDSTNVVHPLISVITNIGMDHMDYLGDTIEKIAKVKAGIIKPGVPVVTAAEKTEALKVIEEDASSKGSPLIVVGRDVLWTRADDELQEPSNRLDYRGLNRSYQGLAVALHGEHQFTNAATALAAAELLQDRFVYKITESAVRDGLNSVQWPGRLELISKDPKILMDAAHNVEGMKSLAKALDEYKEGLYKRKRLLLCLGMLGDKEREKAISIIAPLADKIVITRPDSPRAGDWEHLAVLAGKYIGEKNVRIIEDAESAVRVCLEMMEPQDMLCISGSIYLLADIRNYLLNYYNFSNRFST